MAEWLCEREGRLDSQVKKVSLTFGNGNKGGSIGTETLPPPPLQKKEVKYGMNKKVGR